MGQNFSCAHLRRLCVVLTSSNLCCEVVQIYTLFKGTGATMVGHWPSDGYSHEDSKVTFTSLFRLDFTASRYCRQLQQSQNYCSALL